MKYSALFILALLSCFFFTCKHEEIISEDHDSDLKQLISSHSLTGDLNYFQLPESTDYHHLPNQDVKNPVTEAKVTLGKLLFFETAIGGEPKYPVSLATFSCSSCHIPSRGFTAGRFQGIADGAVGFGSFGEGRKKNDLYQGSEVDAQGARPLPTINLTYVTNALWAGSFGSFGVNKGTESVWHQDTLIEINLTGVEGLEANNQRALTVHRQTITPEIVIKLGYKSFFDAAFPDYSPTERYSKLTAAFAIAAYFRTVLTNQAPFQKYLKGDKTALTENQKEGAILFFGKAGCINCHKSPSFNNMEFQAVGVNNLYQSGYQVFRNDASDRRNLGRGGFTYQEKDMNKFKVPQLYNLKNVGFYFHGASKTTLRDVVQYFNKGVPENPLVKSSQISEFFHPLGLSDLEVDKLTDFITNGLYDADLERYAPSRTMSGNCFPDNDIQSRIDLGCK